MRTVGICGAISFVLLICATQASAGDVSIQASALIKSETGFEFPDGTVQFTAATPANENELLFGSLSVDTGIYRNRIPDFSPSNNYTEVCIKNGQLLNDQHDAHESTSGGDCLPGDIGWLLEEDESETADHWEIAKLECLKRGMRLPEAFEFKISCKNDVALGLINMTGNWEWESNSTFNYFDNASLSAQTGGLGGCDYHRMTVVGTANGASGVHHYRCAK